MGHCSLLDSTVSSRFLKTRVKALRIPSLTLIWVLEYPLVTFLTLLITRDIMGDWKAAVEKQTKYPNDRTRALTRYRVARGRMGTVDSKPGRDALSSQRNVVRCVT
jgi:hypothetical protein